MAAIEQAKISPVTQEATACKLLVWSRSVISQQLCITMEGMSQLQIAEIEPDVLFKERCFLLGDVCQLNVTASGIDTPLQTIPQRQHDEDHYCAHLKAPKGVVSPGVKLRMRYAVILEGPFSFPNGYRRVSSVLFLWCNNPQELQKELSIQLRHWANVAGKGSGLCFMKTNHELGSNESRYNFKPVEGGVFDRDSGCLRVKDHFCLLCTAIDDSKDYTSDRYYAVRCERDQEFRICITYAVPSWFEAIKEYYWRDNGKTSSFDYRDFTWRSTDTPLCLKAPTLKAATAGKGWQYTVLQEKVHFKKLDIETNLNQLQKHCTAEMHKGIYPPSLKFLITYDYDMKQYHKQRTHTVSVTGCDEEEEVTFCIKVFELPGTSVDIHHPARAVSNTCSPEQESQNSLDAGRWRLSTTKKVTQRGAELAPLLPVPEPVSPAGQNDFEGLTVSHGHEGSNVDKDPEQDEAHLSLAVPESRSVGSNMDPMTKWNKSALVALTADLKEHVIIYHGLNDKLEDVAGGFMNRAEAEAVRSKPSSHEQMRQLIKILLGKRNKDFDTFCKMLRNSNNGVWADQLKERARELKRKSGNPAGPMLYVPSGIAIQSGPQVHGRRVMMMKARAHTYQAIPHAGGEEGVYTHQNVDYVYTAPTSMYEGDMS